MTSQHITHLPSVALPRGQRMELITMTTNGNDPLVKLWIERNRLLKLATAAGKKAKSPDDVHERECDALDDKAYDIEGRIANTVAKSLEGLLVQTWLHGDVLKDSGKWIHTPALTRNVAKALERMAGPAVVGM